MPISVLLATALLASVGEPVYLSRVLKPGQKLGYSVESTLLAQRRELGMSTFLPSKIQFRYNFTVDVLKEKADGIVDVRYKRPVFTQVVEEAGFDSVTTKENVNWNLLLTLSPTNEILDLKDETPKKPVKPGGGELLSVRSLKALGAAGFNRVQGEAIGQFVGELYRLSLFIGSLDTALDFQPKIDDDESLSVGSTWKRTVSYRPEKLKSKEGKSVMQRLDVTYVYKGVVESQGKKVHRITSEYGFDSDLLAYFRDNYEDPSGALKQMREMKYRLKANVEFDLDLATRRTIEARAITVGGYQIGVNQFPNQPVVEEKLDGETILKLTGAK